MSSSEKREYSSTQVTFGGRFRQEFLSFSAAVPANMIGEDGREDEPHLTILYGIISDSPETVRSYIEASVPFGVMVSGFSLFELPACDVLKADVISPGAHDLRSKMAAAIPYKTDFPLYSPHITISFLKKDRSKRETEAFMDRLRGASGMSYMADAIVFSPPVGPKTTISLGVKK